MVCSPLPLLPQRADWDARLLPIPESPLGAGARAPTTKVRCPRDQRPLQMSPSPAPLTGLGEVILCDRPNRLFGVYVSCSCRKCTDRRITSQLLTWNCNYIVITFVSIATDRLRPSERR